MVAELADEVTEVFKPVQLNQKILQSILDVHQHIGEYLDIGSYNRYQIAQTQRESIDRIFNECFESAYKGKRIG